jgi:imidazoleglycerol-phosphate dehydratase
LREAKVERKTSEVNISVWLNVDGKGRTDVETGSNFLNHLLITLAKHALFDLTVRAEGDLKHHVCEDVALTLGKALNQAVDKRKGIRRFGFAYVPMDDSLARAVVDLSGRSYINLNLQLKQDQIEDLKTEDIKHFFASLAQTSESNIHLEVLYGENDHHKIEAAIKALATALRGAVSYDSRREGEVPSAKGVL